jgi:hypothetical protein
MRVRLERPGVHRALISWIHDRRSHMGGEVVSWKMKGQGVAGLTGYAGR